jgi:hypothetical protein
MCEREVLAQLPSALLQRFLKLIRAVLIFVKSSLFNSRGSITRVKDRSGLQDRTFRGVRGQQDLRGLVNT